MFLKFGINNKTVKELRKDKCYTAKDLAQRLKLDTSQILDIDNLKFGDVPEPLYSRLFPILSGKEWDKIPWL
jgi:hypothetical protein